MTPKIATRLAFVALLAFGTGCAITDYSLITDNDQVSNGQGSGIVNTNGKAKMHPAVQFAMVYADGTDELFHMVDQKANGDRTISTYNNFSTGGDPTFLDDLYCNPDWQGCAAFTAPDPQTGDIDVFDGQYNPSCPGARSLSKMISTSRYYGECGRARFPLSDRLTLLNMGRIGEVGGREALLYSLGRRDVTIRLDNNAGIERTIPVSGHLEVAMFAGGGRHVKIDATHPLLGGVGHRVADFLEAYGTERTTITITYNGISASIDAGGELFRPERIRSFAKRRF